MEHKKDRISEEYKRACLSITEFDTEDVITTSDPSTDDFEFIITGIDV